MNKDCSIVRDLLPLYAEDMVAPETADFIAGHIAGCEECEKEYETVKSGAAPSPEETEAEKAPLKSIKKTIIRKRIQAVILTVALAAALVATAFAFLTTREYLSYDEAIADIKQSGGNLTAEVTFNDCVTGYDYIFTYEPETDTTSSGEHGWVCRLEAWTTPWDRLFNRSASGTALIEREPGEGEYQTFRVALGTSAEPYPSNAKSRATVDSIDEKGKVIYNFVVTDDENVDHNLEWGWVINARPFSLYYTPNDGSEDVFVFGLNRAGGAQTLPRLTLNYYFYGALGLLALLIAAAFIFRKNETARKWLVRLAFLPLSYVAAHLIVKGFGGASYALMRDFTLILLIAVLLFCAMLISHNIFLLKKEMREA